MNVLYNSDNYKIPVKCWAVDKNNRANVESEALKQAINLANLPFAVKHVALMPDCHVGYGMPIGGVLATNNVVIPNAVGVDIGCGVQASMTTFKAEDMTENVLQEILGIARSIIPVGFEKHETKQINEVFSEAPYNIPIIRQEIDNAKYQLGTLGGGNHFVEIQADNVTGNVWLMVHSGSRNLGKKVADCYNEKAQDRNAKYYSNVDPSIDLAFLPVSSDEGLEYIRSMQFCLQFAKASRTLMMDNLRIAIETVMGETAGTGSIDIHHNFANLETHFGKHVWVHRKGATQAFSGKPGIIPGSMGTSSYIVRGLGNPESFMSCSHGAGRNFSRTEANKTITLEEANKSVEGVVFGQWGKGRKGQPDVSECPLAYKDIDEVMANQTDLVEAVIKLRPLAVLKG